MADLTGMATGVRFRHVQYKNKLYFWNGRNRMRKFDGVNHYMAGIEASSVKPTSASGAAGVLTGDYQHVIVPVNSRHFNAFGQVVAAISRHALGWSLGRRRSRRGQGALVTTRPRAGAATRNP